MSWVKPYRDERGWAFGDGEFEDPVEGMSFLREAYEATTPGYGHHVSVPVLWDRQEHKIVNNESEDIVRFFPTWSDDAPDLYPQDLRDEIDRGQRPRLQHGQQRRLQGRVRTQPARLRARLHAPVRVA